MGATHHPNSRMEMTASLITLPVVDHRDSPDSGEWSMTARQIAATKGEVQMNVHQPGDPIRLSKLGESRIKRAPLA